MWGSERSERPSFAKISKHLTAAISTPAENPTACCTSTPIAPTLGEPSENLESSKAMAEDGKIRGKTFEIQIKWSNNLPGSPCSKNLKYKWYVQSSFVCVWIFHKCHSHIAFAQISNHWIARLNNINNHLARLPNVWAMSHQTRLVHLVSCKLL